MTQDHATPVPRRALMVVRGGTEAGPAPVPPVPASGTGPGTEPAPVPAAAVPMPVPARTRLAVSRWLGTAAKAAGELWLYPGRLIHAAWHGNPKTLAGHRAHIKARGWVPPEMTGKAAAFVTIAGIAYHVVIARYVKAACKAVDGAADYPLRFLGLLVFLAILIVLLFVV